MAGQDIGLKTTFRQSAGPASLSNIMASRARRSHRMAGPSARLGWHSRLSPERTAEHGLVKASGWPVRFCHGAAEKTHAVTGTRLAANMMFPILQDPLVIATTEVPLAQLNTSI